VPAVPAVPALPALPLRWGQGVPLGPSRAAGTGTKRGPAPPVANIAFVSPIYISLISTSFAPAHSSTHTLAQFSKTTTHTHPSPCVSLPSPLPPLRSSLSRPRPLTCPRSPAALYVCSLAHPDVERENRQTDLANQVPCLVAAIPASGCGVSDVKCQCTTGQAAITKSVTSCVSSKCQPDDQASTSTNRPFTSLCTMLTTPQQSSSPSLLASASLPVSPSRSPLASPPRPPPLPLAPLPLLLPLATALLLP
jgi:hypothetical protein